MGSRVYTIDELLAVRATLQSEAEAGPLGPKELSEDFERYSRLWRRYNLILASGPQRGRGDPTMQMSRIVMRYNITQSNTEFKRQWVRTHGTTEGLNRLPRYPVRELSPRVFFLENHIRRLKQIAEELDRLRPVKLAFKGKPVLPHPVPKGTLPSVGGSTGLTSAKWLAGARTVHHSSARKHEKKILMMTHYVSNPHDAFSGPVGGIRLKDANFSFPPPSKRYKKYWYFYRKNGFWRPSVHHPYGDEAQALKTWIDSELIPGRVHEWPK